MKTKKKNLALSIIFESKRNLILLILIIVFNSIFFSGISYVISLLVDIGQTNFIFFWWMLGITIRVVVIAAIFQIVFMKFFYWLGLNGNALISIAHKVSKDFCKQFDYIIILEEGKLIYNDKYEDNKLLSKYLME